MNRSDPYHRLDELAPKGVDGTLSPEEHAELQQLLLESAAARQRYFQLLDLEHGLRQITAEETLAQEDTYPRPPLSAPQPGHKDLSSSRHQQPPRRRIDVALMALTVALAFLLALPLGGYLGRPLWDAAGPGSSTSGPLADADLPAEVPAMVLVQSARSRFFGEPAPPAAGDSLKIDHDYALVEGSVQLRSRTGAELIVQAPAVFTVRSAEEVCLKIGSGSVYAPDGAEGFRVVTPQAKVVDRGTRFSVTVDEGGEANVEVIEGAAEIFPAAENHPPQTSGLLLGAGEGRLIDSTGKVSDLVFLNVGGRYQADLPDRIVDYRATSSTDPVPDLLQEVTVQRGGQMIRYEADQLIGFDLIHFRAGKNNSNLSTPLDEANRADGGDSRSAMLERGTSLSSGVLNPGGSKQPLTSDPDLTHKDWSQRPPGFAIRFHQPVINGPGPDVVLFDLHVVVHPEQGDPFHVSPTRFEPGLRSHTITRYDISLADRAAHQLSGFRLYQFKTPVRSLEELAQAEHNGGVFHAVPAKIIAVGIDLSDLGYPEGAAVSELFFQDALDDDNLIDPVFIGGLPPLP